MTRETAKRIGLGIARRIAGMREIRKVLAPPSILIEPDDARVVWPRTYRQKVEMVAYIAHRYEIKAPPVLPSPHDWPEAGPNLEMSIESQERLNRMARNPEWLQRLARVQERLQLDVEFREQLSRLSRRETSYHLP